MQPGAVGADEDEPGDDRDQQLVGADLGGQVGGHAGDPVQRGVLAPDGAAQQPLRLVDQPGAEVGVNDVGAGAVGVEGQRPPDGRVERVLQAVDGALPAAGQRRRLDQPVGAVDQRAAARPAPARCRRRGARWRAATCSVSRAGGELLAQPGDLGAQVLLGAQRGGAGLGGERVVEHRPAEHPGLDGAGEHRVDPAEVLPFAGDLLRDAAEELQVGLVGAGGRRSASPAPTKWATCTGRVCPNRSTRPMRCSRRLGLNGMS